MLLCPELFLPFPDSLNKYYSKECGKKKCLFVDRKQKDVFAPAVNQCPRCALVQETVANVAPASAAEAAEHGKIGPCLFATNQPKQPKNGLKPCCCGRS